MGGATKAKSATVAVGISEVSGYDDSPNSESDCDATKTYSLELAEENTTARLTSNPIAELPEYTDAFQQGTPHAYRDLIKDELGLSYQRVKYKIKWDDGVTEDARHKVTLLLVFQPETPEGQTEAPDPVIIRTVEWDGTAAESDTLEIDPEEERSGEDGSYFLLPVEVEQEGYTPAKGIRFCRWLNAFPGGLLDPEFADKDRDRFRIKIPGILPNLTKIKIKSTGLHGAVIDGAVVAKATDGGYEVEMKQENGAMVSTWMLLVSDGDDDKGYNGNGTDDGKDDQTLLADFESKIIVTLPEFDNAEVEFTAQKPLGNITLDTVYLSPAGDVPQDMQDLIHRQVAKMQEIYRQIGVRVAWASIVEGVAIPQSWIDVMPNPDPTKPEEPANHLNASECQSARVLVRNRQVPAKHIRIGYINAVMGPDNWFPRRTALGFTDQGTDGIMVSLEEVEARKVLGVTAHEVGHTFGLNHVDPSDFLMKSPLSWSNSRRDSKRFEEGNFNMIKNKEAFYVPMQ